MKKIPLIDENNNIIGETTYKEAKEKGYLRRISRVFLFDAEHNFLLQKRASNVSSFPNYWDHSAGGHLDVGETDEEAAVRELQEELGITAVLEEIATGEKSTDPNDQVISCVYKAVVAVGTTVSFDRQEVSEVKWVTISELEEAIKDNPQQFTRTFISIWTKYRDKLIA